MASNKADNLIAILEIGGGTLEEIMPMGDMVASLHPLVGMFFIGGY